ncbi:MAG: undecaprenyl-diphosphate phosphatase [Sandaracinaceae bacterium]
MPGPIDVGTAAVLGAVQGATEFLPVSSSGHVSLGAMLFGISDDMPLSMVVLLHFGTLIATIALFRQDVLELLKSLGGLRDPKAWMETEQGQLVAGILLASVPTAVIGLGLEEHVEAFGRVPWIVGLCLLGSAVMVLSTRRGGGERTILPLKLALLVGLAQGLAVMPGLSRSGTTIAVGMLLGLSGPAAFRFSFLLSLPAVAGATLLSLRHLDEIRALGIGAVVGGVVALVVGYLALLWLRHIVNQGRFWLFALYLVPLGAGLVLWPLFAGD